jgi:hypothetical protein
MGLFANLVSLEASLNVLDRFIWFGEAGVIETIKNSFTSQKKTILKCKEPFEV